MKRENRSGCLCDGSANNNVTKKNDDKITWKCYGGKLSVSTLSRIGVKTIFVLYLLKTRINVPLKLLI